METWIEIRPLDPSPGPGLRRELERFAWHGIVREKLGSDVKIEYRKTGVPTLGGAPGFISASHTRGWVAVIWSPEPCAIDIEPKTRAISFNVTARYGFTTIEEWCAYEAGYKYESLTGHKPPPDSVRFMPHPDLTVAVISITSEQSIFTY